MTELWVALGAVVLMAFLGFLLYRGTRLDRLHNDVLRSRATLEKLLIMRAHYALEMVAMGEFDPASAMIVTDAAMRSFDDQRELGPDGLGGLAVQEPVLGEEETRSRAIVESQLSEVLRDVLAEPESRTTELAQRLLNAWERIQVARSLHNQKVELTRQLRSNLLVRVFHLYGSAALPVTFEMDDALPAAPLA